MVTTLVLLLSSDSNNSDNLGSGQLQSTNKSKIKHSYTRDSAANPSSRDVHMGLKFKMIAQK